MSHSRLLISKDYEIWFILMSTNYYDVLTRKENGDKSFQSDCRKAYVISKSYGMGDPLAAPVPP